MARLIDVAKHADVSVTTASRVLNKAKYADKVSPEVAQRVRDSAETLGYVGGYLRKTLRTRRSETLGVALEVLAPDASAVGPASSLLKPFFAQCIAGAEQVTHAAGFNLALVVPSNTERAMVRGVSQVRELRLDGLVLLPGGTKDINTAVLRESPLLPLAAVMPSVPTQLPAVGYEPGLIMTMILSHLQGLGHRRVLYLGRANGDPERREEMFRTEAARRGMSAAVCLYPQKPNIHERDETVASRDQATALESYLAARPESFTAVVCYNDFAAVSACRVLERRGLRVPADVSVVGIDNLEPGLMRPMLTSLDLRWVDMGLRAGRLVMEMVDGGPEAVSRYRGYTETIEPQLHVRESTGPAPRQPVDG